MKFLHTSDWHLGMSLRGRISYEKDQRYAINSICEIAINEKVDGILIAGDIFDRSVASAEAIKMYDEIVTYICGELNIPVFIIAGNHDGAERLSQCSELLKKSGLHIAGSLTKEPHVVNMGDVDIYMLPWISTEKVRSVYGETTTDTDAGVMLTDINAEIMLNDVNTEIMSTDLDSEIMSTDVKTEIMSTDKTLDTMNINQLIASENTPTSMESAYKTVLDKYRKLFIPGHKNILLAHAFVVGADTSVSDRAAVIGNATMIGSVVFEGFDYVALGHLHGPQNIKDNIRYSGTPMAYSFGKEEKQDKSVTIIDTDDMSQRIIPVKQLHKRTTLTDTYDTLMRADYAKEVLDGYVRLEVTDCYAGMDSIALFREKYKNLIEISSKGFDRADEKITMTIDEFEQADKDPETIFARYCEDILEEKPSDHMIALFSKALGKYNREVSES